MRTYCNSFILIKINLLYIFGIYLLRKFESMKKLLFAILISFTFSTLSNAVNYRSGSFIAISSAENLYHECCLEDQISLKAFEKAMAGYEKYSPAKPILAICDFTKPSNVERFYIIDVANKKLLKKSLVAHGKNSGGLMATKFSNTPESLQSSLGFYMVSGSIQIPKHGLSLVLDGLEAGVNDNAKMRGIIIHGADYVSEKFVNQYGYCGKSFGCPALPNEVVKEVAPILQNGALLYIFNQ